MKWVHEVDPSTDTYRNSPADRDRVAALVLGLDATEHERRDLLGMLFSPPRNRVIA